MDFIAQRLADGRWVRVLTVVDQFTRECLTLFADTSLNGEKVAMALDKVVSRRGTPQSITLPQLFRGIVTGSPVASSRMAVVGMALPAPADQSATCSRQTRRRPGNIPL